MVHKIRNCVSDAGTRCEQTFGIARLLFGIFEGLSIIMLGLFNWIPPKWIHMIPFVVTILVPVLFSYRAQWALQLRAGK